MSNLNIENLSRIVQTGDAEALMGSGQSSLNIQGPSENRVLQEMGAQGMQVPAPGAAADGKGFSDILRNSIEQVNEYQHEADTSIKELVAGRNKNIHETMLAVERADTSLKLMMQVRNKVLDAYKEIMHMQV
jgi:flagellar hook-basal body complex protein FliE